MTKHKGNNKVFNIMIVVSVLVFLFVGFNFGKQFMRYIEVGDELNGYKAEFMAAEAEYASLCDQRDLLYNNDYIEYVARKNLGMVREGEKLIQVMVEGDAVAMDADFDRNDYLH